MVVFFSQKSYFHLFKDINHILLLIKVSPLQAMKAHGGCGCKGPHIHSHSTRKRQGGQSYARPPLPPGKPPVLILQEAEWTSGPVWTRRTEEKSPLLRHPGSNPGRPARIQAPCDILVIFLELFILNEIIMASSLTSEGASTVTPIILVMTLSSRGRALTQSGNLTNHSCFYNVAQFKCHCSSLLVREVKYYVRPKKILQFQRMRMFLNKVNYFLNIMVKIPYF